MSNAHRVKVPFPRIATTKPKFEVGRMLNCNLHIKWSNIYAYATYCMQNILQINEICIMAKLV